jgi:hypothetical protein
MSYCKSVLYGQVAGSGKIVSELKKFALAEVSRAFDVLRSLPKKSSEFVTSYVKEQHVCTAFLTLEVQFLSTRVPRAGEKCVPALASGVAALIFLLQRSDISPAAAEKLGCSFSQSYNRD